MHRYKTAQRLAVGAITDHESQEPDSAVVELAENFGRQLRLLLMAQAARKQHHGHTFRHVPFFTQRMSVEFAAGPLVCIDVAGNHRDSLGVSTTSDHPIPEIASAGNGLVQEVTVGYAIRRIATRLPGRLFDVNIVEAANPGALRAQVGEQLVPQLAVTHENGINLPAANQVHQKTGIIAQSEKGV